MALHKRTVMKKSFFKRAMSLILAVSTIMGVGVISVAADTGETTAVVSQSGLENVALNKPVTYSANPEIENNFAKVNDGLTGDARISGFKGGYAVFQPDDSGYAWVIIDLLKSYKIHEVYALTKSGDGLYLAVSNDAQTWTEMGFKGHTYTNTFAYSFNFDTFTQTDVRYIKIYGQKDKWLGLQEVSAYASVGYTANNALVKSATASAEDTDHPISGAYDTAWDRTTSNGSYWYATTTDGKAIDATFDIGSVQDIKTIYMTGAPVVHTDGSKQNFKVYIDDTLTEDGIVEKTAENLIYSHGNAPYAYDYGTIAMESAKAGRYITISKDAKAEGETNCFGISELAVMCGKATTENVKLVNVAQYPGVTATAVGTTTNAGHGDSTPSNVLSDNDSAWTSTTAKKDQAYVTIDLGRWYDVRKIAFRATNVLGSAATLQLIDILGSATESFDYDVVKLGDIGFDLLTKGQKVEMDVSVANMVRYIRVKPKERTQFTNLADCIHSNPNDTQWTPWEWGFTQIAIFAEEGVAYEKIDGSAFLLKGHKDSAWSSAANIFDGNASTSVTSGYNYMLIDMLENKDVAAVSVLHGITQDTTEMNYGWSKGRRNYRISASNGTENHSGTIGTKWQRDSIFRKATTFIADDEISTRYLIFDKRIWRTSTDVSTPVNGGAVNNNTDGLIVMPFVDFAIYTKYVPECKIDNLSVSLDEDLVIVEGDFVNNTLTDESTNVVFACYDSTGSTLKGVYIYDTPTDTGLEDVTFTATAGNTAEIYAEGYLEDFNYEDGDVVRVFVMNMSTMKPYCNFVTVGE